MSRLTRRSTSIVAGLLATCALIAVGAGAVGAKSKTKGKADSAVVYAATTHTSGATQFIAGSTKDKLLGAGAITYTIKVASIPSKPGTFNLTVKPVTAWFKKGSLTGTATATLVVGANNAVTVINGKLKETKGTGALKGHSFVGTFTGAGSLATSEYKFNTKGTYK